MKIKSLNGGKEFVSQLLKMGIKIGDVIEVVSIQPLSGPITIKHNNTIISIGRGMAEKIEVELL